MLNGFDVKRFREFRGFTQQDVAQATGINSKKISRLETQRQPLKVADLELLCEKGFGVSVSAFYKWVDAKSDVDTA